MCTSCAWHLSAKTALRRLGHVISGIGVKWGTLFGTGTVPEQGCCTSAMPDSFGSLIHCLRCTSIMEGYVGWSGQLAMCEGLYTADACSEVEAKTERMMMQLDGFVSGAFQQHAASSR